MANWTDSDVPRSTYSATESAILASIYGARDAAWKDNPVCVHCEQPIATAGDSALVYDAARVTHLSPCFVLYVLARNPSFDVRVAAARAAAALSPLPLPNHNA